MKEDFVETKDSDSIKKALENAEIEYEEYDYHDEIIIELSTGMKFYFDSEGLMTGIRP